MKNLIVLFWILGFMQNTYSNETDIREVDLEEAFIIENGYDSNDDIEITVHGQLPSACFKINNVEITKLGSFEYSIKTFMRKKNLSGCANEFINSPINFSRTIALGELDPGSYTFRFRQEGVEQKKLMRVRQSQTNSIDDNFYAPISSAFIPELINFTSSAQVVLTGIFHSNCFKLLPKDIKVIKEGNIFIIIPKARMLSRRSCKSNMYPINQVVPLGAINTEGHYMVHIRSLSGLSVNKVFHVKKNYLPTGGSL